MLRLGSLLSAYSTRWGSITGAFTAGLFVAYLTSLPPHLVHHLFDEDRSLPTCAHLAQSQQTPQLQSDPPTLTPPIATGTLPAQIAESSLPSSDLTVSHPRAPPRPTPPA